MVLEGDPSQGAPSSKKPCDSPELHLPVARDGLRCREVPEQDECDWLMPAKKRKGMSSLCRTLLPA
jgi:hypothetical protein